MVLKIAYQLLPDLWIRYGLADNVVTYVDDVLMNSGYFEDHLQHLETVLEKLTTAGFTTINGNECSFCKSQIKFLGQVINSEALMPDMDRIKASSVIHHLETRGNSADF